MPVARRWARPVSCTTRSACEELEFVVAPGHSGLLALVSDPGAVEIRKALEKADAIVESAIDDVTAKDIKAIAKESKAEEKAARKAADSAVGR